jgi:hypothetical protein
VNAQPDANPDPTPNIPEGAERDGSTSGKTRGGEGRTSAVMAGLVEQLAGDGAAPGAAGADLDIFGRPAPAGRDWSHRRGEPRVFAFFWTLYLLAATVAAFWAVGAPGAHDAMALRPAARSVLAAISVGVALLWPMTRLSQMLPSLYTRRIARAVWQDMVVLLVPAQAIIWPQVAMAAWPVGVVAALAASITAWAVLLGALLTLAMMLTGHRRGWWMVVFVAIAGLGPLVALGPAGGLVHADNTFDWWWMTSPLTSGFELCRDRSWTGASAAVAGGHWRAIGLVGALGACGWCCVPIVAAMRRTLGE